MTSVSLLQGLGALACVLVSGSLAVWLLLSLTAPQPPAATSTSYGKGTRDAFRAALARTLGQPAELQFVEWVGVGYIELTVVVPWWRALALWRRKAKVTAALEAERSAAIEIRIRFVHAWRLQPQRERAHG